MVGPREIYTFGTSNQTLEEFFRVLEKYEVSEIVDVRRFPSSRRFTWFNRKVLEETGLAQGIGYHWLGDLLGGFRKGGYEIYKTEMEYLRGLEEVERIAIASHVVLICAEKLPWKCHRLQIADSLEERGWTVIHIIDREHTWKQDQESFDF